MFIPSKDPYLFFVESVVPPHAELDQVSAIITEEIEKLAMENEAVLKWTEGKTIRKVIVVPGRLVNIAVS